MANPASLHQPDNQEDDGNGKQDINEPSQEMGNQTHQKKNQNNNSNNPEQIDHIDILLFVLTSVFFSIYFSYSRVITSPGEVSNKGQYTDDNEINTHQIIEYLGENHNNNAENKGDYTPDQT
jgi:hypothetical protein